MGLVISTERCLQPLLKDSLGFVFQSTELMEPKKYQIELVLLMGSSGASLGATGWGRGKKDPAQDIYEPKPRTLR